MATYKEYTPDEAKADALSRHPDCTYADWRNGLNWLLEPTIVVVLWRNEECWLNEDPPRHTIQGYPMKPNEVLRKRT